MKNIWKPPFTLKYIFVFDNKGQPCFQFNFDTWDNKKNTEIQQEVIDILNDKTDKKIIFVELDEDTERELEKHILEIEKLLEADKLPKVINKASCKKCAYYEYCYI